MKKINLKISLIGLVISFLLTILLVTSNVYVKNFKTSFFAVDLGLVNNHILKNYFTLDETVGFFSNSLSVYSEWLSSAVFLNSSEEFSKKLNELDKDILVEIKGKNILFITDKTNDIENLTNLINKNIVSELEYFLNYQFKPLVYEKITILEDYKNKNNDYQFSNFEGVEFSLEKYPNLNEFSFGETEYKNRNLNLLSLYKYVNKQKISFNNFDVKNIQNAIVQVKYYTATNIFIQFMFILLISYLLFILIFFKYLFKKN